VKKKTHHHGTELVLWFILWYNSLKIICHTFGTFGFVLRHNFLGVCSSLQIICVVLFTPGYPTQPPTHCLKILLKPLRFVMGKWLCPVIITLFCIKTQTCRQLWLCPVIITLFCLKTQTCRQLWLCPLIITLFCIKTQTCRHYSWRSTLFLLIESHTQRATKPKHKLCHHYSFDNLFFAFCQLSDTQKELLKNSNPINFRRGH